jgi:hypothetical protein
MPNVAPFEPWLAITSNHATAWCDDGETPANNPRLTDLTTTHNHPSWLLVVIRWSDP